LPNADAVPSDTPLTPHLPLPATGPYQVVGYRSSAEGSVIRLGSNPYFQEWSYEALLAGYPDKIVLKSGLDDGVAAVRAVERGAVDLAPVFSSAPTQLRAELRTRYSPQLHENPALDTVALWLNTRVPPFNSVKVRHAIAYAIVRNRI